MKKANHRTRHRSLFIIGFAIYIIAFVAMILQISGEIFGYAILDITWEIHELLEITALFGFAVGLYLIWSGHAAIRKRNEDVELSLKKASGEFQKSLKSHFETWGLSQAEQDVALFTIKGLSLAEIAKLRNTSEGTVKTQSHAIYQKAGVRTRSQLVSVVIEDLLDEN